MSERVVWAALMTYCGDFYCEGEHLLGIYESVAEAEARIEQYKATFKPQHALPAKDFTTSAYTLGTDW